MAFLEPKLTVALTRSDGDTTLTVLRHSPGVINQFSWNLAKMVASGYLGFTQGIGSAILHLLQDAHPDAFAPYPNLIPETSLDDTLMTAYTLIRRSVREKTLVYVAAIDALVASGEPEVTATDIAATWAETRSVLVERYGKAPPAS
ncbi:hypothetical protein NX774_08150 [Massilia agilis]|uniref:Uncharacterized protein n=1 Tax=Massilia agilis TaxID=1811226 RepID=A0ABT2D9T2_9BURK|nr:hypothetical protein [Massilia agilis]MCS0807893.1 hypothetical protein [Massilia agilis]